MKSLPKSFFAMAAIALSCTSCSSDMSDLEQFVQSTKNKFSGSVEPLPQFKPLVVYNAPIPRRDPFNSLSAEVRSNNEENLAANNAAITRPREPLELFPIDSLTMVGTLNKKGTIWGLITDAQKALHRVSIGNYIGQKQGQITAITDSHILVTELTLDSNGLWKDKIIEIQLAE